MVPAAWFVPLVLLTACGGGGGSSTPPPPATYTLTVNTASPASGVSITVSPADKSGASSGTAPFTRTYNSGTTVTLTAPAKAGSNTFASWTGCAPANTPACTVTLNAATTALATYAPPAITAVSVAPGPTASVIIGATQQFTATVTGNGNHSSAVTWSLLGPPGSTLSPGTLSSTGLYTTPFPAPASVTIVATSNQDATVSGSTTLTLNAPATAAAPAMTVDTSAITHAINPDIYGMDAYQLQSSVAKATSLPVARWGGDNTSRYNYLLKDTNAAGDYYFENESGSYAVGPTGFFDDLVTADAATHTKTMGTVPVLGWVAKDATSCSFPVSLYPNQQEVEANRGCGNGIYAQGVNGCTSSGGCAVTGNDPTLTSTAVGPSFAGAWVTALVGKFGTAANGGVAFYDLDNEPSWWDAVHRDVHPNPSTYDEVTNNGLATAQAIKAADPTAAVSGPVVDYWWNYFYSKKDIESGWGSGPCYQPWDNPVDRKAHSGIPFLEYYLQQFQAYETAHGQRLLDYLDLHTYFAADYNGSSVAFSTAGDTGAQQVRLNSTRVFWDPTYTDPNYPQPNYSTDANFTSSCKVPLQAPQLIPAMHTWVNAAYPGTKTAITEYNWGGQEHINGALAQADILGIFGREGLDLGTLWGPPDPASQVPGLMAFEVFRNYDGNGSQFGDQSLTSTSASQGQLSIYGAERSSDNAITLLVLNKTYGDLTGPISLQNLATKATKAKVWLYSVANLAAITARPDIAITPPPTGSTTATITATFPAQSITLLVLPKQ